ncbi:carbon-nitrogen hydrolase family protein [Peijinzhouia sedimentorum]
MKKLKPAKVALVQVSPVFQNLEKSIIKLKELLIEAKSNGAELVVFGETWLCGYPSWLDYCPNVAVWDAPEVKEAFLEMYHNSIEAGGKEMQSIQELVAKLGVYVVLGANESVSSGFGGKGTIYNSMFILGPDGTIQNHHRKLMPTYTEKMLYGHGDGAGLKSVQSPFGNITGAICWEHWMPLTRQALHQAGEHIHVALWPMVHERHEIASRHYAFEGRCYVLAIGQIMKAADFPKGIELPLQLQEDPQIQTLRGGSCVIGPDGNYILPPVFDKELIIYAELDANEVIKERMTLDVTGHYNRNDIFDFSINDSRK